MSTDIGAVMSPLELEVASGHPAGLEFDLDRLLTRLDTTLLKTRPTHSLRRNAYQRARVAANLEHARSLLLRLEHDANAPSGSGASTPKPFAARVSSGLGSNLLSVQVATVSKEDLQRKRNLIKQLQDALHDLDDEDSHAGQSKPSSTNSVSSESNEASSDEEDEDEVDALLQYAPATQTSSGIDTDRGDERNQLDPQKAMATAAASMVASSLRSRTNAPSTAQATASGREQPQVGPGQSLPTTVPFAPAPSSSPTSHAQLLESHDAEQDQLTSSLLSLASALKQSTKSFSETLLGSEGLVDQAAAALDKNVGGMESASNRMGLLRRVTEGRGWWARLGLFAKIGILWVLIILLVFVAPKLRF